MAQQKDLQEVAIAASHQRRPDLLGTPENVALSF